MCADSFQVQAASVLFVDNPVGTGFSYTDRPNGFATNVAMVAADMMVLLQHFFMERAEFQVCRLDTLNSLGHYPIAGCSTGDPLSISG